MKVFMLGWEFPPHISGGLGTACYGMTRGLDEIGVEVCFVLPTAVPLDAQSHVQLRSPTDLQPQRTPAAQPGQTLGPDGPDEMPAFRNVELRPVQAMLQAYASPVTYEQTARTLIGPSWSAPTAGAAGEAVLDSITPSMPPAAAQPGGFVTGGAGANYGGNLMDQVQRYARLAMGIARSSNFDVIHAHDWMTYPAGLAVAACCGKPLVVHVHSTEFDRSGDNVNQQVYEIERTGMHCASKVVCVSHLTRNLVIQRYGVPAEKVAVVYNATEAESVAQLPTEPIRQDEKIVLFLGRITMQKGPEYFLQAAKKVIEKYDKVRFIMAGSGDMMVRCIQMAVDMKLGRYVTFPGFLRGRDVSRVMKMADLYVMPSVSEPFGIAPLEALSHDVPVIISKQSGVSEVLTHVLKVDFWDTDEMANKILAVLRHAPLRKTLRQHGQIELRKLSWIDSAKQLQEIYDEVAVSKGHA